MLTAEGLVRPVPKRGVLVTGGGARGLAQVTAVYNSNYASDLGGDAYYWPILQEMGKACLEAGVAVDTIGHEGPLHSVTFQGREPAAIGHGVILLAETSALNLPFMTSFSGPAVQVDHDLPELHCDSVVVDSHASGALAVRHLVELGHSRIAYLGWRLEEQLNPDRRQGIRDELARHGLAPVAEIGLRSAPSDPEGYLAVKELLFREARATAIVAFSNEIARVAVQALEEDGRQVPQDISVIGVGAADSPRPLEKRLTYVDVDPMGLGRFAFERLIWRAANITAAPEKLSHPVKLVQGETCAGPRGPAGQEA